MFSREMGHMEDAGLPRRIPFCRPNRPFIAQMVGTNEQPVDRFNRATTKIHHWTHLAIRNARPFHQVDRITPVKEGHRKSGHRSRQNPDLQPGRETQPSHKDDDGTKFHKKPEDLGQVPTGNGVRI